MTAVFTVCNENDRRLHDKPIISQLDLVGFQQDKKGNSARHIASCARIFAGRICHRADFCVCFLFVRRRAVNASTTTKKSAVVFQRRCTSNVAAVAGGGEIVPTKSGLRLNTAALSLNGQQLSAFDSCKPEQQHSSPFLPRRKKQRKSTWYSSLHNFSSLRRIVMHSNGGIKKSPNSVGNLVSLKNSSAGKSLRSESMAYPSSKVDTLISRVHFHARKNTKAVVCSIAFLFVLLIITSDAIHDMGHVGRTALGGLRGTSSMAATADQIAHWGGAMHAGNFHIEDAVITPADVNSNTKSYHFSAVTDLDQLSAVKDARKPEFRSLFLPGILKRTGTTKYDISFDEPRTLVTKHNEAGRGAEFSELTIYNDRLLTFDDRTGDVFEIINNVDGTASEVVPRFVITEGEGDTDKGMKWEWATVKDGELYMGSMGKEYTRPDGSILNENNLWIGILNARGELRRENWKEKYSVIREALGAEAPGYVIMEAILWSAHMKKWVFLPRRISSEKYDENQDEHNGGTKLVLVNGKFTKADVVDIALETEGLRGFSSFAFVPDTQDRHALAIRSVEENCTGDLNVCQQRSYFSVFDVKTGEVLSEEKRYKENMKFEGVEFANMFSKPRQQ